MLKRKNIIALALSCSIIFSSVGDSLYELTIYAEEYLNQKQDELNSHNVETEHEDLTITTPSNSDVVENTTPDNDSESNNNGDITNDSTENVDGDISNPTQNASITLVEPSSKLIKGVYYTEKDSISFTYNTTGIEDISLSNSDGSEFNLNNVNITKNDSSITLEFINLELYKVNSAILKFKPKDGFSLSDEENNYSLSFCKKSAEYTPSLELYGDNIGNIENGIYYLNSNMDEFQLCLNSKDSYNKDFVIDKNELIEANKLNGETIFDINYKLEDDKYIFTISNISEDVENKTNTVTISFKDYNDKKYNVSFKFHKDTILPTVSINETSGVLSKQQYIDNKKVYYLNYAETDLTLKLTDSDTVEFTEENIFINDEPLSNFKKNIFKNNDFSASYNKSTKELSLSNIKDSTEYTISFKNLKDNHGNAIDIEDNTYIIYKDITPIEIYSKSHDSISFKEGTTIYKKYSTDPNENKITLQFGDKSNSDNILIGEIDYIDLTNNSNTNYTIHLDGNDLILTFDGDAEVKLNIKATDFSGNESSLTYTIINDTTDYSNINIEDVLSTTFNGKEPQTSSKEEYNYNNEFYINNETMIRADFESSFEFNYDSTKFGVSKPGDNNVIFEDQVGINIKDNNNFSYNLFAKNGSLNNKSLEYIIYYDNSDDFQLSITNNDIDIIQSLYYSDDANANFNPQITVSDKNLKAIEHIDLTIEYKDTDGKLVSSKTYNKDDFKHNNTNSYTLDKSAILEMLNMDMDKQFKDGEYNITLKVKSRFNNDYEEETRKFRIDSNAPKAKFVVYNNKNNINGNDHKLSRFEFLDSTHRYINTQNAYIAIPKSDYDNVDYGASDKVTVSLSDIINDFTLNSNKVLKNGDDVVVIENNNTAYVLYKVTSPRLTEDNTNVNFEISIKDHKSDYHNTTDLGKIAYTVDNKGADISFIAKSNNSSNLDVILNNNDDKSPFVNPKSLDVTFIDNTKVDSNIVLNDGSFFSLFKANNSVDIKDKKYIDLLKLGMDFSDGHYVIKITTTDEAGNITYGTFKISIDTVAPSINMNDLTKNLAFDSIPSINVNIGKSSFFARLFDTNPRVTDNLDATTKIDLKLTDIYKNTNNVDFTQIVGDNDSSSNFKLSLSEGIYEVKLIATDKAGNTNNLAEKGKVTLDTSKPKVTVDFISDSGKNSFGPGSNSIEHENTSTVKPIITIEDISALEDPDMMSDHITANIVGTKLSSNPSLQSTKFNKAGYTKIIELSPISSEDVYNFSVSVRDRIKNRESVSSNINFGIDRTEPALDVTVGGKSVSEGATIYLNAKDNKNLTATVKDNISTSDELITDISLNSSNIRGTSYTFNTDNKYSVKVTTKDRANNSKDISFTVIVDTTLPKIEIADVEEGQYTNEDILPNITIEDKQITEDYKLTESITLNGVPYEKGTKIKAENDYSLVVRAEDEAGNVSESTVNFVIDKTKPEIIIEGLENNKTYLEGRIIPNIYAKDKDDQTSLTMTLTTTESLNPKDYDGGEITEDDKYVLHVKAVDRASNKSEARISFNVNLLPPEILINNIKDNDVFYEPVTPDITIKDFKKSTILLNGSDYLPGDRISKPGDYTLFVTAEDEYGLVSEKTVKFTIKESNATLDSENNEKRMNATAYKALAISGIASLSLVSLAAYFILNKKRLNR